MQAIDTALGGTLRRMSDGQYQWSDGAAEPRVRALLLSEVAPNFRCTTFGDRRCYVEVPADWRARRYWPDGRVDTQAASAIAEALAEGGTPAAIYAEGIAEMIDDHRLQKRGYWLPVELWDAALLEACGVSWPREHEADILARARALGWGG